MTKQNLISLIVIVSLLGYVFYHSSFYRQNATQEVLTVVINDEGFSPDKIVIHVGSTVTWVGGGERLHWPASNFHPNHTLYPEPGGCLGSKLDACKGLAKGESFSFTFDKVGIWPMHDHLSPGLSMTVEVLPAGEDSGSSTLIYDAKTSVTDFRKFDYAKQLDFVRQMSTDDPQRAWSYIKEAFVVNGQVVGNAHEFAHIIGNASYKKSGLTGIKICDVTFAFGCFHGVTEAMLLKEGPAKITEIEKGCLEIFPPNLSQGYTGCIHGTGHGIYTWEGGDLKQALLDCDAISESNRQYCYDGVFMENSTSGKAVVFDAKDPWKFCTDLNDRYHRNCARYQSQVFLHQAPPLNSMEEVGKNCALGPTPLLRETCYGSLGYYITQKYLGNVPNIFASCRRMPDADGVALCTIGSATEIVFQRYGDFDKSYKELCGRLPDPRNTECLNRISQMIQNHAI